MPYIRLSSFYFFYFALLGAMIPYWTLYLSELGYSAAAIGGVMAIVHGTRVIAPNIWGWLADRFENRLRVIRWGAGLTCLAFSAIFYIEGFYSLAVVMMVFSFFWNAILPQFEVVTLAHLASRRDFYSRIRLWGSIGFIVAVMGVGAWLDWVEIEWLPHMLMGLMLLIWFNSLLIPAASVKKRHNLVGQGDFKRLLMRPSVIAFFVVTLLIQLSHGPYYTFYSVLLESLGYERSTIGLLWSLGVVAEVVLFVYMPQLLKMFSLRCLILSALVLSALRWFVIALWPEYLAVLLGAQLLHAASFGVMHATGIAFVHQNFSERTYGQAQALFSSFGFGLGGALGAMLSGLLWQKLSSQGVFLVAGVVVVIAIAVSFCWLNDRSNIETDCDADTQRDGVH